MKKWKRGWKRTTAIFLAVVLIESAGNFSALAASGGNIEKTVSSNEIGDTLANMESPGSAETPVETEDIPTDLDNMDSGAENEENAEGTVSGNEFVDSSTEGESPDPAMKRENDTKQEVEEETTDTGPVLAAHDQLIYANGMDITIESGETVNGIQYTKIRYGDDSWLDFSSLEGIVHFSDKHQADLSDFVIYGGFEDGTGSDAVIHINGGELNTVYGDGATVNMTNGTVFSVYGGSDTTNITTGTNVQISGGTVTNVYGGGNNGDVVFESSAKAAFVTIDGGMVENVYGGGNYSSVKGDVSVEILNAAVIGNVYGGGNYGNVSKDTTVNIKGGTITKDVYGSGAASGSKVYSANIFVTGGQMQNISGDIVDGGVVTDQIKIEVTDGTVSGFIKGKQSDSSNVVDVTGYVTAKIMDEELADTFTNLLYKTDNGYAITGNNVCMRENLTINENESLLIQNGDRLFLDSYTLTNNGTLAFIGSGLIDTDSEGNLINNGIITLDGEYHTHDDVHYMEMDNDAVNHTVVEACVNCPVGYKRDNRTETHTYDAVTGLCSGCQYQAAASVTVDDRITYYDTFADAVTYENENSFETGVVTLLQNHTLTEKVTIMGSLVIADGMILNIGEGGVLSIENTASSQGLIAAADIVHGKTHNYYGSFAEALNDAVKNSDMTLILLKDIGCADGISLLPGQSMTLDLNTFTLELGNNGIIHNGGAGNPLTLKGTGKIEGAINLLDGLLVLKGAPVITGDITIENIDIPVQVAADLGNASYKIKTSDIGVCAVKANGFTGELDPLWFTSAMDGYVVVLKNSKK